MKRRTFLKTAGAAVTTVALGGMQGANAATKQPNVFMIAVDDLNDWIGCFGGHPQVKTPNMDRLSKRSTVFHNAHCPAPICNPARPAMLTGLRPSTTGHYFLSPNFEEVEAYKGATTLPEYFSQNGYHTLGTGKIFHGGSPHKPYFDEFGPRGSAGPRPEEKISYPMGHPLWDWGAYPERDEQMPDYQCNEWVLKQLEREFDKPYFLALGYSRPHVPLYVPQKWFDMYPLEDIILPDVLAKDREDVPKYGRDLTYGVTPPPHSWIVDHGEWKHAVQAYLACITFVDDLLGKVLDAVEARGDADNTVIVFFSDHGFHMGEKQYWAKRSLWDRSTKVPMMISAPGLDKHQRCDKPTNLMDIYNTLVDLCDLPENPRLEGQSLVPLLKKPKRDWKRPSLTTFGQNNHGLRSERYRYIRYNDGSEEFYDHKHDPNEWHNLAGQSKYETLMAEHRNWLPRVNTPECPKTEGSGWEASEYAQGRLDLPAKDVEGRIVGESS